MNSCGRGNATGGQQRDDRPRFTGFRPGDEVYGDNLSLKGGFAEYAVAPQSVLAHKPEGLTFAETSTIPQAGVIAMQGTSNIRSGQRMLINGAGGGSGSFAIQLAKQAGAYVRASTTTTSSSSCSRWGQTTWSTTGARTSPDSHPSTSCSIWSHIARCSPTGGRWLVAAVSLRRRAVRTFVRILTLGVDRASHGSAGREAGAGTLRAGRRAMPDGYLRIHIDQTFGLEAVPRAPAHVGEGHALGKVVVEVS